jgi:polyferredoxin
MSGLGPPVPKVLVYLMVWANFFNFQAFSLWKMRAPHVTVLSAIEKVLSAISFGNFQAFSLWEMRTPHVPVLLSKEKVLSAILLATSRLFPYGR